MRTLITSNDEKLTGKLRQVLLDEGQDVNFVTLDEGVNSLGQYQPELIVAILPPDIELSLRRLAELRVMTQARVFAVGPTNDSRLVLRALRGGADDYIDLADLNAELQ